MSETMRSYRVVRYGEPLEPAEAPLPVPVESEVLVRVTACGVCHSDLHYWHGGYELGGGKRYTLTERGVSLPITLGHEPLGEVVAVGPEAEMTVGQTRLVYPWIGCGECSRCAAERDTDCLRMRTLGLFRPGGYATHMLVPHPRYLLDVEGLPDTYACTLACAGVTAWVALQKTRLAYRDDALVIVGVGGVGMTALGLAVARGHEPIVVVDRDEARLETARRAGAHEVVLADGDTTKRRLLKAADGGAGTVIDFVGRPETAQLGLDVLRKGGRYVSVGLYGGSLEFPLAMFALRNISVVGTLTGTVAETQEVIDFVRGRDVQRVPVTPRPLAEATEALQDLEAGRVTGRTVLVP